eukprot:scaffold103126_cov48-Phaeocystis_antarctica.AAC.1
MQVPTSVSKGLFLSSPYTTVLGLASSQDYERASRVARVPNESCVAGGIDSVRSTPQDDELPTGVPRMLEVMQQPNPHPHPNPNPNPNPKLNPHPHLNPHPNPNPHLHPNQVMQQGRYFGEIAMMLGKDAKCTATCIANGSKVRA